MPKAVGNNLTVKLLDKSTWSAFAELIQRHNGVWGGCWCMGFHESTQDELDNQIPKRERKERRVCEGRAQAVLVFDGVQAVGWCQYGPGTELKPQNKFKRKYLSGVEQEPDWKITCFFVDKKYRGRGVSSLALDAALHAIACAGGGLVEAYPECTEGRKVSAVFICLGTIDMFEKRGFTKLRQVAMHHWVMLKQVDSLENAGSSSCQQNCWDL